MSGLSRQGWIEIARRAALETALVVAAVQAFGYGNWWFAVLPIALGLGIYIALPRPRVPNGAMVIARMPSVCMPDLLGALLVTTFLALPFIVSARDSMLNSPWGLLMMTGIPALVSLLIFWIASKSQCHWVRLGDGHLMVATIHGQVDVALADIMTVRPEVRYPPKWLGPLLVLFGGLRGAGIAMLHAYRPSHALIVERRHGDPIKLPTDSFPDERRLLRKLEHAGVPLADELRA